MYKKYYQKFLKVNRGIQHYAAHSHHFWPDVSFDATIQYWQDSAKYTDDKWNYFFSEKVPVAQKLIADNLNISRPEQIVFAPNTHEFVYRILSCLDPKKKNSILTTDSEFYSFDRQINRISEDADFQVDKISTEDFSTFEDRFISKISEKEYDLIFFSHVFFNSGLVLKNLYKIIDAVKNPNCIVVIDGYHSFMAIPTDLRPIENRIFYLAGSYKYAQGGEGCCFLYVPPQCSLRPVYTGWFASFSSLTEKGGTTVYSEDGMRFAGSTMDYTALYRLISVLQLFSNEKISVSKIHQHIQLLQINFREEIDKLNHPLLNENNLIRIDDSRQGHFYCFELGDSDVVKKIYQDLYKKNIRTDFRKSRLRFGFGLYQEERIDLKHV